MKIDIKYLPNRHISYTADGITTKMSDREAVGHLYAALKAIEDKRYYGSEEREKAQKELHTLMDKSHDTIARIEYQNEELQTQIQDLHKKLNATRALATVLLNEAKGIIDVDDLLNNLVSNNPDMLMSYVKKKEAPPAELPIDGRLQELADRYRIEAKYLAQLKKDYPTVTRGGDYRTDSFIPAIKRCRELTGLGLSEAKALVEALYLV